MIIKFVFVFLKICYKLALNSKEIILNMRINKIKLVTIFYSVYTTRFKLKKNFLEDKIKKLL